MSYNGTIAIYTTNEGGERKDLLPSFVLKNISMQQLQKEAHQRATTLGFKRTSNWRNRKKTESIWWESYASRDYTNENGAEVLVVVRRS